MAFILFLVQGGDTLPWLSQGQTHCVSYIVSTLLTFLNASINPIIFCKNKELRCFVLGLACRSNKVGPVYILVARLCTVSNYIVNNSSLSSLRKKSKKDEGVEKETARARLGLSVLSESRV